MPELLTTEETAQWLGMSPRSLERLRHEGHEPGSLAIRIGHRTVRYSRSDLEDWLAAAGHRDEQIGH